MGPLNKDEHYIPRCWIHTHPCFKAFMSSTDIYQFYAGECQYRHSFGIVLSPRAEGVKALCVHLTDDGFEEIGRYCNEAMVEGKDTKDHVSVRLQGSVRKYYCQIPFTTSSEPCTLLDLRSRDEVIGQLTESLEAGNTAKYW